MPLRRRSEGSASGGKDYNIREDRELGQKAIAQKNTWHFPRLPRPFQIFQRKIWGRPFGQIMPTALFGLIYVIFSNNYLTEFITYGMFKLKVRENEDF